MAPLGETIAVIDKSGKVVSTSKHLFGVFKEARNAYRECKAQIQSERNAKIAEQQALRALQNCHIDDGRSVASSHRSGRSHSRHHSTRSHYQQYPSPDSQSFCSRPGDIARRHTDYDIVAREPPRPMTSRSRSDKDIDMNLAYGECHPSVLTRQVARPPDEQELDGLVGRAERLLEEADCLQHSAQAAINHLQENPKAMAAVALTLAEISNLVMKMAPSALASLKASCPAIFALLASPQFLIAAGVGIGVTIVMFGGYKIIKQIQSADGNNNNSCRNCNNHNNSRFVRNGQPPMDEMLELNTECLSHVEMWRRGVADVEAASVATSVDGEFITPIAARMSGMDISTEAMKRDPRFKFNDDDGASRSSSRRSHRARSTRVSSRPPPPSEAPPKTRSKSFSNVFHHPPPKAPSKYESQVSEVEKKPKEKKKRSSRLRFLLKA